MKIFSIVVAMVVLVTVTAASAPGASPGPAETRLISASLSDPLVPGDNTSGHPSMSSDGRYLVFDSTASNLTSVGTTGAQSQVYLHDVMTGVTETISTPDGKAAGNGSSRSPEISADGTTVVFLSAATNLVPMASSGITQVMVWSRATHSVRLASMSNDGVPVPADRNAADASISADGTVVAFSSYATNLVRTSTLGQSQVYSRDVKANVTSLLSIDPKTSLGGASESRRPTVSGDGRTVAFESVVELTPIPALGQYQIYLSDRASGALTMASTDSGGTRGADSGAYEPSLSADGQAVVFESTASNLTRLGGNGIRQVYVRDLLPNGHTDVITAGATRGTLANSVGFASDISPDGRTVVFASSATNLVAATGPRHATLVYVRHRDSNRTTLVCRAPGSGAPCSGSATDPSISSDASLVAFGYRGDDLGSGTAASTTDQIYLHNATAVPRVDRIGGADRFVVSAGVSADAFSTDVPVVYVALGGGFADALSGSAAAGAGQGPVLLVTKDSIPLDVGIELHRLQPQKIVVLGGTNSISSGVESGLATYAPTVVRIGGADRYEVSAAVSAAVFAMASGDPRPAVYVASGEVFPDALSGSAAAGRLGGPVLLVQKNAVPSAIAAELARLAPSKIVVLGGTNTISEPVFASLARFGATIRLAGADRFDVSTAVSADAFPSGAHTVYVASGAVFPDALSGSAGAIKAEGPVLLVTGSGIPRAVARELDRLNPTRIVVLGGIDTVADGVLTQLATYLTPVP